MVSSEELIIIVQVLSEELVRLGQDPPAIISSYCQSKNCRLSSDHQLHDKDVPCRIHSNEASSALVSLLKSITSSKRECATMDTRPEISSTPSQFPNQHLLSPSSFDSTILNADQASSAQRVNSAVTLKDISIAAPSIRLISSPSSELVTMTTPSDSDAHFYRRPSSSSSSSTHSLETDLSHIIGLDSRANSCSSSVGLYDEYLGNLPHQNVPANPSSGSTDFNLSSLSTALPAMNPLQSHTHTPASKVPHITPQSSLSGYSNNSGPPSSASSIISLSNHDDDIDQRFTDILNLSSHLSHEKMVSFGARFDSNASLDPTFDVSAAANVRGQTSDRGSFSINTISRLPGHLSINTNMSDGSPITSDPRSPTTPLDAMISSTSNYSPNLTLSSCVVSGSGSSSMNPSSMGFNMSMGGLPHNHSFHSTSHSHSNIHSPQSLSTASSTVNTPRFGANVDSRGLSHQHSTGSTGSSPISNAVPHMSHFSSGGISSSYSHPYHSYSSVPNPSLGIPQPNVQSVSMQSMHGQGHLPPLPSGQNHIRYQQGSSFQSAHTNHQMMNSSVNPASGSFHPPQFHFQQYSSGPYQPPFQGSNSHLPQHFHPGTSISPPPAPHLPVYLHPDDLDRDMSTLQCRNCNQLGHMQRYCPKLICYNCKQLGHMSSVCPLRSSQ